MNQKNKKDDEKESYSNETEVNENISDIKNVELYVTDFKYNDQINGYTYEKVELTNDKIDIIKKEAKNINLNKKNDKTVYGKYKLVLDNKIIYFDPDNEYGLYSNGNYGITLSNDLKKQIIPNVKLCSCCTNNNCNINLCSCN